MRNEYRKALETICALCERARGIPSKRQERIHDIAMEALGMTYNQRQEVLQTVLQRTRDQMQAKREKHGCFEGVGYTPLYQKKEAA